MMRAVHFAAFFFCLGGQLIFAETWSGYLVDLNCYQDARHDTNRNDASTVDRDVLLDARSCRPNEKTKAFAVIDQNSHINKLDSAGNEKAGDFVAKNSGRSLIPVTVTGEMNGSAIKVGSISRSK
jgi:hypothetical protein